MWVILAVLAFACAVILERSVFYYLYCRTDGDSLVHKVLTAIEVKNADQAMKIVNRRKTPFNNLIKVAVERYTCGAAFEGIMESVEKRSIKELPRLFCRTSYLSLFANIATLLGLLGTITGLQTSFGSLGSVDAASKASMLADGISEAMNTTAFGLIVAVPCMIMYTVLNNRQQALIKDIDDGIATFLDAIREMKNEDAA